MVAAQGFDHGFDGVIEISVDYGKSVDGYIRRQELGIEVFKKVNVSFAASGTSVIELR